jgi:hypothetical protein
VLDGLAPPALVDSYHEERAFAADDNLLNSTRSTDFITPKNAASLRIRDAVLELARSEPFARPLVNSGPAVHADALCEFVAEHRTPRTSPARCARAATAPTHRWCSTARPAGS